MLVKNGGPLLVKTDSRVRETWDHSLAKIVQEAIPKDQRVLVSRPQTAYLARRSYFLSEYDTEAATLLGTLSDPVNRITLIAEDSNDMFRDMVPTDRPKVREYMASHFSRIGVSHGSAVYRRTRW